MRAVCGSCGVRPVTSRGGGKYRKVCRPCHTGLNGSISAVVRRRLGFYGLKLHLKKKKCSRCGFVAEHPCQLDIDHRDGNRNNIDITNLQILCANCHRLKTYLNKDWIVV